MILRVHTALFFCVALLSVNAQPQPLDTKPESLAEFQARLQAFVSRPHFSAAALGVKVESLDTGKILFEQNADKLLKPASNAKLYSGALALDRFGPDHRIKTSFYAAAKPDSAGTLKGDLIVYGRGDPSLSARFHNGDYNKPMQQLVAALEAAGIKKISGDLIGDDSFFRGAPFGSSWTWEDLQYYYGAEVSALTLQDNVVDLVFRPGSAVGEPVRIITKPETTYLTFSNRTETVAKGGRRSIQLYRPIGENVVYVSGSLPIEDSGHEDAVTVSRPALWFVTQLKQALARRGIEVTGQLRAVNWLDRDVKPLDFTKLIEVAHVESRPMAELVKLMMKPSQNLYAHLLLLQAGERARDGDSRQSSENLGVAELGRFLAEAGIQRGDVLLDEGSGLSRGCLLKPAASIQLLKHMNKHRYADAFKETLPIAGVDGTLRSRFKGAFAEKNLRAKTGTIRYVNALSGYVTTRGNEQLVFSIMLNNFSHPTLSGRVESDALAAMLADFAGHSSN